MSVSFIKVWKLKSERVSKCQMSNFSAILWREQVRFWWDYDDDILFVLDEHVELKLYIASSLKKSPHRHVAPLKHIILIASQSIFALTP